MRHISEEKRLLILNAAAEAFSERGYYETSIRDITERAGVSAGTFYIYYKNKDDILLSLYNQFAENAKLAINQTPLAGSAEYDEILAVCTLSLLKLYCRHEKLSLILLTKTIGINKTAEEQYYKIFYEMSMAIHNIILNINTDFLNDMNPTDKYSVSIAYLQVVNGLAAKWLADSSSSTFSELCYSVLKYNFNALSIKTDNEKIRKLIAANIERND